MKKGWDLLPVSVVSNKWLLSDILAPYQLQKLIDKRSEVVRSIETALPALPLSASSHQAAIYFQAECQSEQFW